MVLDWATLGRDVFPIASDAHLSDVPLFIPHRLEHFNPNQVIQSPGHCFKMKTMANLRYFNISNKIIAVFPS